MIAQSQSLPNQGTRSTNVSECVKNQAALVSIPSKSGNPVDRLFRIVGDNGTGKSQSLPNQGTRSTKYKTLRRTVRLLQSQSLPNQGTRSTDPAIAQEVNRTAQSQSLPNQGTRSTLDLYDAICMTALSQSLPNQGTRSTSFRPLMSSKSRRVSIPSKSGNPVDLVLDIETTGLDVSIPSKSGNPVDPILRKLAQDIKELSQSLPNQGTRSTRCRPGGRIGGLRVSIPSKSGNPVDLVPCE